ncbi:translation initiation factor [Trypanosoma rangeli]|uniref:Translation initiation factor n=1 Tax=Trypanosoma rangeli TaxID=5698 RepID=A0A3R7JYX9_TRYRA|nr:translation initiation factor [Trypanosoma rangeli]RNE99083.1 translation initiation factor [Trypanosoma rangeli]|eukprot:RNE99083.1 translation initiation factor [Trypanosoma rangeli]
MEDQTKPVSRIKRHDRGTVEDKSKQMPQEEVKQGEIKQEEVPQQKRLKSRPKAPMAVVAAPEATILAHKDPVTMGPVAPAGPAPPSAAAVTALTMADQTAALHVAGDVKDIFEIAYDNYTSKDLQALLKRVTRQEVEKRILEVEQLRQGQNVSQVERFLDVTSKMASSSGGNNAPEEGCGYNYSVMLRRLFVALNRNKESSAMSERNKLPEPKLEKIGKKRVIISNFGRICQAFHRPVQDVKDYIEKELSVAGNLDINDALILKYEIQKSTAFDNIFYKYLDEFVKCNSCNKLDTTLTKEGRRMELRCNWCTATRTVQAVGSATYSAQVGKRSKARLQAMTL